MDSNIGHPLATEILRKNAAFWQTTPLNHTILLNPEPQSEAIEPPEDESRPSLYPRTFSATPDIDSVDDDAITPPDDVSTLPDDVTTRTDFCFTEVAAL